MSGIYFRDGFERAFGTYPLTGARCEQAVEAALGIGYRAIDTAQMYGNEAEVGAAIAASAVPRGELLVTTKVHPDNFDGARFIPSLEKSLKDLRLDVIDVLLLHWPPADGEIGPSLDLLCDARAKGLARHIGVSNYTAAMMRETARRVEGPIATNQVEFHPLLDQSVLLAAASETGIPISAYSAVARGKVFENPLFAEIGADYNRSAGQIVLRWILQKGVAVTAMSTKPENMRANLDVMGFTLSSVDMARIDAVTKTNYRLVTSDLVPWAPEWD